MLEAFVALMVWSMYRSWEPKGSQLGVSRRTLRTDIAYLKRVYPDKLITHRGRYTGGLEWVE